MSSFSRTASSSNEKLITTNQNEVRSSNQLADKRQVTNQLNTTSNRNSPNPINQQTSTFKMSISPSLSSANSNQSSAASSVQSLIDQEDLTSLTNYVKNFREQLGKLRRILSNEINQRKDEDSLSKESSIKDLSNKELYQSKETKDAAKELSGKELIEKQEIFKAQVHDKLADVLRILKMIFERFSQVQSSDLFVCSKNLIEGIKAFDYTDSSAKLFELNELLDKIDQLAICFSQSVSQYLLMEGDCSAQASQQKTKSSASFDYSTNQSKYVCDSNNNNLNQQPNLTASFSIANSSDNAEYLWNSVYNMFHQQFHKHIIKDASKKDDSSWDTQAQLTSDECDEIIQRMNSAVEFALQNAKVWSKYTKDISIYIEKRINFQMENSKNLLKLAQTMKPILSDNLPLQQLYLNMLDLDIKNHKAYFANCSLLLGHKFLEPLTILRNENEKCRKACKNQWNREFKKLQDSVNNLKKARSTYIAKKIELERAKQALKMVLETGSITSSYNLSSNLNQSTNQPSFMQSSNLSQQLNHIQMESTSEQIKLDKKRKYEEDAAQKTLDAENVYRQAVIDANERARTCENIKKTILNRIKDLDYKSDLTLTSVTGNYLQIQKLVTSAEPIDFQQLLKEVENTNSYGNSTSLSDYLAKLRDSNQAILNCFTFVAYETNTELNQATGSMSFERNSDFEIQPELMELELSLNQASSSINVDNKQNLNSSSNRVVALGTSFTKNESIAGDEESNEQQATCSNSNKADQSVSNVEQSSASSSKKSSYRKTKIFTKVAASHHFRTVRTLSKCKECDVMNFNFQGLECTQCGICVHKKCIETLTIKCGLKPLSSKRTNIFTFDLCNQSNNNDVPFIVKKCIQEINRRGLSINGLYRVSGVKSQVEKLCSDFEFGGELVDLGNISPTVLTSVLKCYFRALPTPLLTYRLYNDFIKIGKRYPNIKSELLNSTDELELINNSSCQSLLKELRNTLFKLPEVHLNTLDYLMKHLKKVSDNSVNNMPANNLGIVFGPTLLRANEANATSLSTLVDTVHQNRVIELLIINYNELFGGNLVEDEETVNDEFDEMIEGLKAIGVEDEEDEEDPEIELDNLIQDLNKTELLSSSTKEYQPKYHHLQHLQSKDSEDFTSPSYLKNQNSIDKSNELRVTSGKFQSHRPSLHELKRQFFTETTSTTSPFQSIDDFDKRSLNIDDRNLDSNQIEKQSTSKQSNSQLSQSKSPKSSTLQLFKSKDDREPKYV